MKDDRQDDFGKAVEDVEPLQAPRRVFHSRPRPAPLPRETWRDERAALSESLGPVSVDDAIESGEERAFVRSGYPYAMLRKLRRGHWVVEDHLDLHGMNRAEAAVAVREFCAARVRDAWGACASCMARDSARAIASRCSRARSTTGSSSATR